MSQATSTTHTSAPKTSIVCPIFNQLHYTKQFIESLEKNTKIPYKLIIVDNGSNEDTQEYVNKLDAKIIRNDKNMGVAYAWDQGIKACDTEFICIMNNDIEVAPNWLTPLQKALERRDAHCVQPLTTSGDKPDNFPNNFYPKVEIEETDRLQGWCFMLPMQVIKEIGSIDTNYEVAWYEDRDFNFRLNDKGYKPHIVHSSYIHHYQNRTLWKVKGVEKKMAENQLKFIEKWGDKVLEILSPDDMKESEVIDLEKSIKEKTKMIKEEILNKDK